MSTKATTYESLDNKIAASALTEDLVKGLEVVDGHAIKEKKVGLKERRNILKRVMGKLRTIIETFSWE